MIKKRIVFFSLCIVFPLFVFCSERGKVVWMAENMASRLTDKQFDRRLISYFKKGLTPKSKSPAVQQRIDQRVEALGLGRKKPSREWTQEDFDFFKKAGISPELIDLIKRLGPKEALKRLGQKVPKDPTEFKEKVKFEFKTKPEAFKTNLKTPPPPPGAPSPPGPGQPGAKNPPY